MRPEREQELELEIAAAVENSAEKVEAMAELAWQIWATDLTRARELSQEALRIAEENGYLQARAYARRNIGLLFFKGANLEESLEHLNWALKWFETNKHGHGEAEVRLGLAYLYWSFGGFKRGLDEGLKSLALFEESGEPDGIGWACTALGSFYYDWDDHGQAQEYFERALEIFERTGNQVGIGRSLNGLGNVLAVPGKFEEALEYQDRSLAANRSVSNEFAAAKTLNDIGLILQRQGKHEAALEYHREALAIREGLDYTTGEVTCHLDIGTVFIETRAYDDARDSLNKALVLAQEIHSKPKMCRAHELLSNLYRDLAQFDTALVHFENFHRIREEVFHEDSESRLDNMRKAYQVEATEREAEIYRLKNVELKSKNDELEDTLLKLQGAQAQLIQSGKMAALGSLVAGITHEVTQPIGAMKSAADVAARAIKRIGDIPVGSGELARLVDMLRVNNDTASDGAARIETILKSLKSFSRLDEADFQKSDIHEGLESTLTLIGPGIPDGVIIEKDYGDVNACFMYPGELNQVFMNLLLNAIDAVDGGGVIGIRTWAADGFINIQVTDTGRGIPEDKLKDLFDPGFTTRDSRVRMRTGLYTSLAIVHKHHGEINVVSNPGKGTTFTITFPDHLDRLINAAR
jgi:signal transduction histidine kinase